MMLLVILHIKIKRELEIILTNLDDIKNNLNIRKLILINEEIKTKTLIKTETKLTNTILSIIQKTSIKIKQLLIKKEKHLHISLF